MPEWTSRSLWGYIDRANLLIDRIININASLGAIPDMCSFLESVVKVAMDFTTATRAGFFKMEGVNRPRIVVAQNLDMVTQAQSMLISSAVTRAAREGEEVLSPGLKGRGQLSDRVLAEVGIKSLVCIPARINDQLLGLLYLDNCLEPKSFAENLLPYVRLLCNQIAIRLSNIGIYEETTNVKNGGEDEISFCSGSTGKANPFSAVIGNSEAMKAILNQVRQVAPTDSTTLIVGETGVGKELVARAIHNLSKRREGPFVPTNLAALPDDLVASELFGYEKGAFTGAGERRQGRFELADGGTIFLDEIGDMSPEVQVKLLRVLQEGTFERLGSGRPVKSNFRVIAATHRDLNKEIEKGVFRRDLYYRLNVFPIHVPPLRDRREDIPLLAHHFVDVFCRKMHKKIRWISSAELGRLIEYHWPGNVRELEHIVERAVIIMNGKGITFPDLVQTSAGFPDRELGMMSLADVEREHIRRILANTGWRVGGRNGAAAILGLKPTTLFFRIKKLGITRPSSMSLQKQARIRYGREQRTRPSDRPLAISSHWLLLRLI